MLILQVSNAGVKKSGSETRTSFGGTALGRLNSTLVRVRLLWEVVTWSSVMGNQTVGSQRRREDMTSHRSNNQCARTTFKSKNHGYDTQEALYGFLTEQSHLASQKCFLRPSRFLRLVNLMCPPWFCPRVLLVACIHDSCLWSIIQSAIIM